MPLTPFESDLLELLGASSFEEHARGLELSFTRLEDRGCTLAFARPALRFLWLRPLDLRRRLRREAAAVHLSDRFGPDVLLDCPPVPEVLALLRVRGLLAGPHGEVARVLARDGFSGTCGELLDLSGALVA